MNSSLATTKGTLFIVATPIGNLSDITLRALETLKKVDLILAEDTRCAKKLLNAYNITSKITAFHAHNEAKLAAKVIDQILHGLNVALISDAGTPMIQDPGFPLVKQAISASIPIVPIPGACALITALSAAGINCDRFLYGGFLNPKATARSKQLTELKKHECSVILYESTHRIIATIKAIKAIFGADYSFVIAKELTKAFETFIRGVAQDMLNYFAQDSSHIKGEFVILLPPKEDKSNIYNDDVLLKVLLEDLPLKQAVNIAAKLSETPKNKLYKLALSKV
ncbi:MAG: 16S rRNA (cytidine(1402)-2'-O)-methyltransferase [Legionellales bacterium RIFCSPHIGHO2_12_FULL_37_14]|nr:MAG: 16S rRNA (cytidine(1402)-2'-O)-methyltransferase [Legionellales bacterium RIFCSPHIGHO2_12_FULL_37_14]